MDNNINSIIANMPLELKVGQLFLLAYPGKDPSLIAPIVERYGIAGCYISQDNAETFEEARHITTSLQAMAKKTQSALPLIMGVDQEGAWGVLIPEAHIGPGNLALGAADNIAIVADMYRIFGEEMSSVGYNAIFAPCADVNFNPYSPIIGTRSFGNNPRAVADAVAAAVNAARNTGVLTAIKHFPGHGDTGLDTHRDIPIIDKSMSKLLAQDLLPFMAGIEAGSDMVMTSHILFPQIDKKNPATLSTKILNDLLRDRLKFRGVIISDSMNMGAIRRHYDPAESTVLALKAGVDIIMLSEEHYDHDSDYLKHQLASLEAVCKSVQTGVLSEECIDEKLRRIIAMKQHMFSQPIESTSDTMLSISQKKEIVNRAAREALAFFGNEDGMQVPTDATTLCVNATPRSAYVRLMNPRGIGPNQKKPGFDVFKETLISMGCSMQFLELDQAIAEHHTLDRVQTLILVTEDAPLPGEDLEKEVQQQFVLDCLKHYRAKCLIVGLRSPYELLHYGDDTRYLCAYSNRICSAEQVAYVIGNNEPIRHRKFSTEFGHQFRSP